MFLFVITEWLGHYGNYGKLLDAVKSDVVVKVVDFVLCGCRFPSPALFVLISL